MEIEQHHIGHSHLDIVDVRHFLLRKVDAELIGLNIAMYGSAAGGIELPNAAALMTMQYHIDIDDDSCLPLAEVRKSKHGDPCECHLVFTLDPRMPRCLIESFLGMCGFDYALSSTEIGLFGRSFWRLPVSSRITMTKMAVGKRPTLTLVPKSTCSLCTTLDRKKLTYLRQTIWAQLGPSTSRK